MSIVFVAAATALSVGYTYLSARKLQTEAMSTESTAQRGNPSATVELGAFVPRVIGRRKVGPIILWVGNRSIKQEKVQVSGGGGGKGGGGGGGGSQTVNFYYEEGWHALCVGPAYSLRNIRSNGRMIFRGPITRTSHPSGTTINLGNIGVFKIYWGEAGQPTNAFLGNASRVAVTSRWPNLCYIQWTSKRLGTDPVWPNLEYEIETRPEALTLAGSSAYISPTLTLTSTANNVFSSTGGAFGTAKIVVSGNVTAKYRPGTLFLLSGNSVTANGVYTVFSAVYNTSTRRTTIRTLETLTSPNSSGTIQPYLRAYDFGVNPAHILYELMFAPWPHGLGLSTGDYNLTSLQALGVLLQSERCVMNISSSAGEDNSALIGRILVDAGVMIPWNMFDGQYRFKAIRQYAGSKPSISHHLVMDPLPEYTMIDDDVPSSRVAYSFNDVAMRYKMNYIAIDEDGTARQDAHPGVRTTELSTVTDVTTAGLVSERRAQEDLNNASTVIVVNANRQARLLMPGQVVDIAPVRDHLRLLEVEANDMSGRTILRLVPDHYGVADTAFRQSNKAEEPEPLEVEPDQADVVVELPPPPPGDGPGGWGGGGGSGSLPGMSVLRLRGNNAVEGAVIWASADDTTYVQIGHITSVATGGQLTEDLDITSDPVVENGPAFDIIGPDFANIVDYSGDEASWRMGRQLCIIGNEIFFVRNIEVIDADSARLRGLIRARLGSDQEAHVIDDWVYIIPAASVQVFQDRLCFPGQTVFLKIQPYGEGSIDLDEIEPIEYDIVGRGVKPIPPVNLGTLNNRSSWVTGDDAEIRWSPRTIGMTNLGAGLQPAGSPVWSEVLPPEMFFAVRIYDGATLVRHEVVQSASEFVYTQAMMTEDFGSEPASFTVTVTTIEKGFESEVAEAEIIKE